MDDGGPYERYYADRKAAGERTVLWPWVLLAVVVPLLLVRSFLVAGGPAEATATRMSAAPVPVATADGEFPVGTVLEPGIYGSPGPDGGRTCEYVRVGADGVQVARAVLNGPAAVRLVAGETVTFAGGCAWSRR
ncbi:MULTISPECIES: hypothetical protein [Pseudonocardia]|uniref:Uncharacterized protein n=2 Tax=Pseudonocardia TaxID=1847 RepID=A0A1Y2N4Q0_PSEAH|nr:MULTISPECIES: hypothetical protein [Pseudonocardia]OSY42109.1 hypothetical protein BG845_01605 [Pseudonocardia autotrophica]TDN75123.1 hypothetical protein C8E95_4266 [Pseudonocardia autotrophica]BBF99068.1 hypothetical protein Pdca_02780 [Pseudonocardia autotrophica]GEC23988.1 hypothetical protein PSA01_10170 [Pseudonocardia saturnea]